MTNKTRKWLHGLVAAIIGGGAGAVTSGLTSMGFAPDKFNLSDVNGIFRLLGLVGANFIVSGIFSMMFYLRQAPLPDAGDTDISTKPPNEPPKSP